MWQLGKLTANLLKATGSTAVVPAFNGYQVDYIDVPTDQPGVVAAAQQLNAAFSWMYNLKSAAAPSLGLGNCVWVLVDVAYAGGFVCADQRTVGISSLLGLKEDRSRLESGIVSSTAGNGSNHHRRLLQVAAEASRQLLVPANQQLKIQLLSGLAVQRTIIGNSQRIQMLPIDASVDALQVIWQ